MSPDIALQQLTESMLLVLVLSLPPILVASVVGIAISLLQALTQVQEQTQHGVAVVPVSDVPEIAKNAGLSSSQSDQLQSLYSTSQLEALRLSFAALSLISCAALFFSRNLPSKVPEDAPAPVPPAAAPGGARKHPDKKEAT